jgi:hypothetical protein
VLVADRVEGVKWRNWKIVFYDEERDWWTPPLKLGQAKAFNLITDPKEEYPATGIRSTWNAGPPLKILAEFEESLKRYRPSRLAHPIRTRHPKPSRNDAVRSRDVDAGDSMPCRIAKL